MVYTGVAAVRGQQAREKENEQSRQEIVERIENADDVSDLTAGVTYMLNETERIHEQGGKTESDVILEESGVFGTVSQDYGDELDGFTLYTIPEEYALYGGYFPEEVQKYTYCLCKQYGVRYSLVVAMIERESGYQYDRIGDDGQSMGYMQIWQSAHTDRMERLGVSDLKDPYQNIRVGVNYIAELIEKYGTMQDALAAYNYGEAGAKKHLWSNGVFVYDYNQTIMSRMKEIEEEMEQ